MTIDQAIASEYHSLREHVYRTAGEALRAARIRVRFGAAEDEGRVRLVTRGDCEPYDASYVDTWEDLSPARRERAKAEILARVADEGSTGIVAEVRCPCCDAWREVDACYGFIGDDWQGSGYDDDLRLAALDALDAGGC